MLTSACEFLTLILSPSSGKGVSTPVGLSWGETTTEPLQVRHSYGDMGNTEPFMRNPQRHQYLQYQQGKKTDITKPTQPGNKKKLHCFFMCMCSPQTCCECTPAWVAGAAQLCKVHVVFRFQTILLCQSDI